MFNKTYREYQCRGINVYPDPDIADPSQYSSEFVELCEEFLVNQDSFAEFCRAKEGSS